MIVYLIYMVLITMYWQYVIMEHHWRNAGNNYRVPNYILMSYGF